MHRAALALRRCEVGTLDAERRPPAGPPSCNTITVTESNIPTRGTQAHRPGRRRPRWPHSRVRREFARFLAGARGPLTAAEFSLAFGPYQRPSDGEIDEILARETERMAGAR